MALETWAQFESVTVLLYSSKLPTHEESFSSIPDHHVMSLHIASRSHLLRGALPHHGCRAMPLAVLMLMLPHVDVQDSFLSLSQLESFELPLLGSIKDSTIPAT